jgi:hypothetical protein
MSMTPMKARSTLNGALVASGLTHLRRTTALSAELRHSHTREWHSKHELWRLALPPPRSGGVPSARQDGALLYPGPLCGGEAGTTGRVAGVDRMSTPFRQHRDVLSKSPALTHGLAGHGCPASAKRGGLSLGHVSLATQRKVARAPKAHESSRFLGRWATHGANKDAGPQRLLG